MQRSGQAGQAGNEHCWVTQALRFQPNEVRLEFKKQGANIGE